MLLRTTSTIRFDVQYMPATRRHDVDAGGRRHDIHSEARTAAELAVIVLIRLGAEKVGRDHARRRRWLRREVELCDVPHRFADAFDRLADSRNPARYAEGSIIEDAAAIGVLHATVADLVGYAAAKVA